MNVSLLKADWEPGRWCLRSWRTGFEKRLHNCVTFTIEALIMYLRITIYLKIKVMMWCSLEASGTLQHMNYQWQHGSGQRYTASTGENGLRLKTDMCLREEGRWAEEMDNSWDFLSAHTTPEAELSVLLLSSHCLRTPHLSSNILIFVSPTELPWGKVMSIFGLSGLSTVTGRQSFNRIPK